MPKDLAAAPPPLPIGARLLQRDVESDVAGRGVTDEMLDDADGHIEQRRRGGGPAQQMIDFAEPLIDLTGSDEAGLNRAMTLAMAFWNLALSRDDAAHEELLSRVLSTLPEGEQARAEFRVLAATMVKRHRAMFPEMHREARAARG